MPRHIRPPAGPALLRAALLPLALAASATPALAQRGARDGDPYRPYVAASDSAGWALSAVLDGRFRTSLDRSVRHGGTAALRFEPHPKNRGGAATVEQAVRAEPWRGKRVRVRGWVRSENVARATVTASVRGEHEGSIVGLRSYTNGADAPISGTHDWTAVERVVEVPANAEYLVLSFSLTPSLAAVRDGALVPSRPAGGVLWVDDVTLEAVGADVPLSVDSQGRIGTCCPDSPAQLAAKRAWIATLPTTFVNGGFEVEVAQQTK